ncbi:MAG TPA: PHP domain-containing protein, partial [Burkholderiaceae bacterium]|nr:PHP domain-containing protein [Burkholderiaceae bacterium]
AGLPWVSGVEVSVTFAGTTVHVIGLGFDIDDAALLQGLAATRAGRQERARAMARDLARVGIEGCYEGALRHAGNPSLISRTHFARHLVASGVCASAHEVFRKYLVAGKPGHVPHRWAALGDAVSWITGAGGLAVIAHPARYRLGVNEEFALFSEFRAHGGQGVEVVTGNHTTADVRKYAALAQEFGLLASRGSDFHAPGESRVDLGSLPALPAGLEPVWAALTPPPTVRHRPA